MIEQSDYDVLLAWMVSHVPDSVRGKETDPHKILDRAYARQRWQIRKYEDSLKKKG